MSEVRYLPVKGEYHDNFLSAQVAAEGELDRDSQKCLFNRLEWIEPLHRLALPDRSPLLLRAQAGEASAWMPLMRQGRWHYVALANWYNFSWRPIFGSDYDAVTRLALLRQFAETAKHHSRRITLAPVPDEDEAASEIAAAFTACGWVAQSSQCDENHYLNLNGRSFDAYWEGRPGTLRNTVKRKGKKGVVAIRIDQTFTDAAWADYEAVYARSWKPHEGSPAFLKVIARQEAAAGTLRLGLAYIEGQPVAAQFWTVENGTALVHKLAHDERHVSLSPGTLLFAAMFRHMIDVDKVAQIDCGTGSDAYKRQWMEDVRPRYRIDLLWPSHLANWPIIARHRLRQIRRWAA